MSVNTLSATLLAALLLVAPACEDGGSPTDSDATDVVTGDVVTGDATDTSLPADTAQAGDFACGAYETCGQDSACASRGQGACIGDAPDENGHCRPNCSPYECGGGPTCLCDSYWCVDLPPSCNSCGCATAPDASCNCDDSSGHVVFSCMGA